MIKMLGTICCFTLAGSASTLASAADRAGAFFVRPSVGYYFPASKRHLQSTVTQGMTLGYDFTDRWAAAAGATLINTNQKSDIGSAHVHGFIYTVDAIYRLNDYGRFKPYLMAGPAVTTLKPATGSDPEAMTGLSVAAGAGYYFSDSVAMTFEARDLYTISGGKNDVLLTAGVTFLFGGH